MSVDIAKTQLPEESRVPGAHARSGLGHELHAHGAAADADAKKQSLNKHDLYQDITRQLARLNLSLKHNTAAFDIQRNDVADLRKDVDGQRQSLESLQRRFSTVETTVTSEFRSLGDTCAAGFANLCATINAASKLEDEEHKRLIATIKGFAQAK